MRIFLPLLGLILFIASCKQPAKKSSTDLDEMAKELKKNSPGINAGAENFSIKAAEGWAKMDTNISGLKCLFVTSALEDENDRFRENLNVVTERCGSMGLEAYMAATRTNLKTLTGYEEQKVSDKSINGMDFTNIKYSHTYGGMPIDVDLYVTVKEGVAYLITCSVKKGELGRWDKYFQPMVESFTIN